MKARLIFPDAETAKKLDLEQVTELECNEAYCATSHGYPVFLLPNEEMIDCQKFRQFRDEYGARLETDCLTKVCLGIGIPRNEPGLVEIK
ncbi:MAG: hypothetical protein R2940_06060 [Syntrophotaleaceae bacterium]